MPSSACPTCGTHDTKGDLTSTVGSGDNNVRAGSPLAMGAPPGGEVDDGGGYVGTGWVWGDGENGRSLYFLSILL